MLKDGWFFDNFFDRENAMRRVFALCLVAFACVAAHPPSARAAGTITLRPAQLLREWEQVSPVVPPPATCVRPPLPRPKPLPFPPDDWPPRPKPLPLPPKPWPLPYPHPYGPCFPVSPLLAVEA